MDTNLAKNLINVLWHDPNIGKDDNNENQQYYDIFEENFNDLIGFPDYAEAFKYLQSYPGKLTVITSGLNGEEFLRSIEDLQSVNTIIVFCNNADYHRGWMSRYPKVRAVINSGPYEVIEEIRKIYSHEITGEFLRFAHPEMGQLADTMTGTQTESIRDPTYFQLMQDVEMEFRAVFITYMKNIHTSTPLAEKVLQELQSLNPERKNSIKRIYEEKGSDLLEAMIYLYSTDYVYDRLNVFLASNQYDKIKNITAAILQEIKKRPDLKIDLPMKDGDFLYRGICHPGIESQYEVNKRGFWPAFTSTSLKEDVANRFSGCDGVIFRIKLSDTNPHPHISINKGKSLSQYSNEEEVLLLSYFAMIVTNVTKIKNLTYIDLVQDEKEQVLSLNDDKFKNYWEQAIEQEMEPKVNDFLKEAKQETEQRLKNFTYVPREVCKDIFECLKKFWDTCPYVVVRDMLEALKDKNSIFNAFNGNRDIITSGFLEMIFKGLLSLNKEVKEVLTEVFDNFKTKFQTLLRAMLASDYNLNSLPQINNFNSLFSYEIIMGSLDYSLFFCEINTRSEEEWINIIEEQTKSPKFVSMMNSLVMSHLDKSFADLKKELLMVIKTTMGL